MARNGIYLARAREQIAQQRAENECEHRRRVDDAYRRVPGLRALDQTLQQQMITLVGLTMRHGSDPTDELRALAPAMSPETAKSETTALFAAIQGIAQLRSSGRLELLTPVSATDLADSLVKRVLRDAAAQNG